MSYTFSVNLKILSLKRKGQYLWFAGILVGIAGLCSLMLGYVWGLFFPVNKNLWTSFFVLYAGGWSLLLLSVFYLIIIEVLNYFNGKSIHGLAMSTDVMNIGDIPAVQPKEKAKV